METASELLDQHIDKIMMRWEARAYKEVPAALGQTSLFLRNALPKFLKSLVILL